MFIIENGKISGNKTVDIGKSIIVNLQFKSDIAFADDDKLLLNIGGLQSSNYAFTQNGCFRFSYVNVGSLIKSSSNSVNVVITNNGNQILSDSITILAEYSGGGSGGGGDIDLSNYATKDYVIENAPIKTAPITLGCNSYDSNTNTGTLADGGNFTFNVGISKGETITLTYVISSEYDISPNDEFGVALTLLPYRSNPSITAKLYLNDQLIRQSSINIEKLNWVEPLRYVIGLNTNYKDEILKNNIGKTLKLQLLFSQGGTATETIQLAKNIPIYGINQIENKNAIGAFIQQYTDKEKNQGYFADPTTSINFNKSNAFYVPQSSLSVPIQDLTLKITNSGVYNLTYIITTAQTFTYTATIESGFYLNKPLDLQPNKTYAICQYYNYIFWTQLTAYGA